MMLRRIGKLIKFLWLPGRWRRRPMREDAPAPPRAARAARAARADVFELQHLPVGSVAVWLRALGEAIVLGLLPGPHAAASERYTERVAQLADPDPMLNDHATIFSAQALVDKRHSTLVMELIQAGQPPVRSWRIQAIDETHRLLGMHINGFHLPQAMWPLAAARAWQAPGFDYWVQQQVEAALGYLWFYPEGELPAAHFSTQTFWLLLAGYPFPNVRFRRPPLPLLTLRERALALGYGPKGWANYWDQWLLLQAVRQWQRRRLNIAWPNDVLDALTKLPLAAVARQQPAPVHDLVVADWEAEMPAWFRAWLQAGLLLPSF